MMDHEQLTESEGQTTVNHEEPDQSSDKVIHTNNCLPNGCVIHELNNFDDNGIIKIKSGEEEGKSKVQTKTCENAQCGNGDNDTQSRSNDQTTQDKCDQSGVTEKQDSKKEELKTVDETDIAGSLAKISVSEEIAVNDEDEDISKEAATGKAKVLIHRDMIGRFVDIINCSMF